jgi:transposase
MAKSRASHLVRPVQDRYAAGQSIPGAAGERRPGAPGATVRRAEGVCPDLWRHAEEQFLRCHQVLLNRRVDDTVHHAEHQVNGPRAGLAQDNGRKRHLIVDTKGLLMTVKVTPADVTDRDAARELLPELRERNPELTLMWGDNGYTGLADWARNDLDLTFKVVKKPPNQIGFKVLPRRWIVERSLSWLMRARRNARDYERLPEHSEAHITWANITLMTRRLARAQDQRQGAEPSSIAA